MIAKPIKILATEYTPAKVIPDILPARIAIPKIGKERDDEENAVAYLHYKLYDKDSNMLAEGRKAITRKSRDDLGRHSLGGGDREHELIELNFMAPDSGYAEVYISGATTSGRKAYFDDYKVEVMNVNLIPPYYPYLYNGKEFIDDFDLNWSDYGARMYDAGIGRWGCVDPLGEMMADQSPYNYSYNDPILYIDPLGLAPEKTTEEMVEEAWNNTGENENKTFYYNSEGECPTCPQGEEAKNTYEDGAIVENNQGKWQFNNGEWADLGEGTVQSGVEGVQSGGNDNLGFARNIGQGAGYVSGGLGFAQVSLLEYRQGLNIHQRINTSTRFFPTYRGLGVASKALGRAGNVGAGLGFYLDTRSFATGEIGLGRYAYRTTGLGVSIGVGVTVGGPPGAAAGAAVGGIFSASEYIYDNMLVPLYNEVQYQMWNFERAVKNGWYPGR
ncbi:MAG: hypothetical protein KDD36_12565 [Flavobacteriales bacterium]|nr:hypothetical protein [Flavobacteriales bacterium]